MDARDLLSISTPAARRRARIAVCVLALTIACGLWQGYGALWSSSHVH